MSNRFVVVFEAPAAIVEVRMPAVPSDAIGLCEVLGDIVASAEDRDGIEPRIPLSVRRAGLPRPHMVDGFHLDGRWWTHEVAAVDRLDAEFQGRWRAVMSCGRPSSVADLAARMADVSVWSVSSVDGRGARVHPAIMPAAAAAQAAPLAI